MQLLRSNKLMMFIFIMILMTSCGTANDHPVEPKAKAKNDSIELLPQQMKQQGLNNNQAIQEHNQRVKQITDGMYNKVSSLQKEMQDEKGFYRLKNNPQHTKLTKFNLKSSSKPAESRNGQTSLTTRKPRFAEPVRGIYVSGHIASSAKQMSRLMKLLQQTELNAVVLDIKNDSGYVTYRSKEPMVQRVHADRHRMIPDINKLIAQLKRENIYIIGRIVTFKDPYLAAADKSLAMHRKNGAVWHDQRGVSWVDPYNSRVWDYNIAIAREAAALGVDEIQFDYVRFPENGPKIDREVKFINTEGRNKAQVIGQFLQEVKRALPEVVVSADVFGLTTSVKDDMGIGQRWNTIAQTVDVISPMVYPSHYSSGMYGIKHPDLAPGSVITHAMRDALQLNQKLAQANKPAASIRPWLQSFTASWIRPHQQYRQKQLRAQIEAAQKLGIREYLLWDPRCRYSFFR